MSNLTVYDSTEQLIINTFPYAQYIQWASTPAYLLVIASIVTSKTTRQSSFFHLVLANAIPDFIGIITGSMPVMYEKFPVRKYQQVLELHFYFVDVPKYFCKFPRIFTAWCGNWSTNFGR